MVTLRISSIKYSNCHYAGYMISHTVNLHPTPSLLCLAGKNIHKVLNIPYTQICKDLQNSLENISLQPCDEMDRGRSLM